MDFAAARMNNTFFQRGVEIVKTAIEADNAGNYSEAYTQYKQALEAFMIGLKCESDVLPACAPRLSPRRVADLADEKNPTVRDIILQRVKGYMDRAEQLKQSISGGGPAQKAAPAAAGCDGWGRGGSPGAASRLADGV